MKLLLLYAIIGISSGLSLNKQNDSPIQELYEDFEQDFEYESKKPKFQDRLTKDSENDLVEESENDLEQSLENGSIQQPKTQFMDNSNNNPTSESISKPIMKANSEPVEKLDSKPIKKSNSESGNKLNNEPIKKFNNEPVKKLKDVPEKKPSNKIVKKTNKDSAKKKGSEPNKESKNITVPKLTNDTALKLKNNTAPEFKNKTEEPKKNLTQEQVWFPLPKGFDQTKPDEILEHVRAAYQEDVDKLPFTHFYVFGDSACDTNNLFDNNRGLDPDPKIYWKGRVSNGPIWPDYLEARFRLKRRNYAFIGSTISGSNYQFTEKIPDLSKQIDTYNATKFNTSSPLAIIQYIGNDLINHAVSAKKVAADLKVQLQRLVDIGEIRHIMIIETTSLAYIKKKYNEKVSEMVEEFKKENPTVEILCNPIIGHYANMLSVPPPTADLGKWHSTDAFCYNQTSDQPPCPDPQNFFLYDLYHPSTVPSFNVAVHLAKKIKEFFSIPVPDFYISP